jgi:hypothetical protein
VLGGDDTPAIAYVDSSHGTGTPDLQPVAGHIVLVHGGPIHLVFQDPAVDIHI